MPEFFMAVLTLSFDSFTADPGSPTISKQGKPFDMSTSTFTAYPFIPLTAPLKTLDSINTPPIYRYMITTCMFFSNIYESFR